VSGMARAMDTKRRVRRCVMVIYRKIFIQITRHMKPVMFVSCVSQNPSVCSADASMADMSAITPSVFWMLDTCPTPRAVSAAKHAAPGAGAAGREP
jgi:hypothetical protein